MDGYEIVAREIVKVCLGNADEPEVAPVMAILQRRYGIGNPVEGVQTIEFECPSCGEISKLQGAGSTIRIAPGSFQVHCPVCGTLFEVRTNFYEIEDEAET